MKLTKNTLIEGTIFRKGTEIIIKLKEMPHLAFKDGTPFDVELEAHLRDEEELFDYFYKVLSGNTFNYKYGDNVQLTFQQRKELAEYLITDNSVKLMLLKKYDQSVYNDFVSMVKSFKW